MTHPFIMPTIGRIVHLHNGPACLLKIPVAKDCDHLAAIVTGVTDEGRHINVAVFDVFGAPHALQYVPLVQGDDADIPKDAMYYCTWMPYQKGQAAKTEQAERAARSLQERAGCEKCIGECQGHVEMAPSALGITLGASTGVDHASGRDETVRLFLDKGQVVKVNGIPVELDHDAVVRIRSANVPLLSVSCVSRDKPAG
jgi:hypothetical protein